MDFLWKQNQLKHLIIKIHQGKSELPLIKKKKFGSTVWSFDANSKVLVKRVYNTEEKQDDWPFNSIDKQFFRESTTILTQQEFVSGLITVIKHISSTNLQFKFIWALKRLPDEPSKLYAIFIKEHELHGEELDLFTKHRLILAKFAGFYILTRSNEVSFFENAIEFYQRFDQLVLPDKTDPFLIYGNRNESELVLLFYCDINGNGMLIKSKGLESKISPEREIEILRLGAIIGVDVPQRSAVIKLNPADELVTEFSAGQNNNILVQKLIPGAFPLYSATELDIDILVKTNCVNLGKMIIFDVVAGSWDRHSGNYVIHPLGGVLNEFSLAEIDFGLFDPSWYPPADFNQDETVTLSITETPPAYSPREGWALIRHPSVTEMVKKCDQKKVLKGLDIGISKLKHFLEETKNINEIFSEDLAERIINLFKKDTKVRILLESELAKINFTIDLLQSISEL